MNSKRRKIIISGILVLAVMAVIFYMSAENGEDSSGTSEKVIRFLLKIFVSGFGDLSKTEQLLMIDRVSGVIRECAHFAEFAGLGLALELHMHCLNKKWMPALITGILYALSDEIHQLFVPERAFQILDLCLDSAGVICGALIMLGIIKLCSKRIKQTT